MIKYSLHRKFTGYGSAWLERTAGGREVAGSNPVTPIFLSEDAETGRLWSAQVAGRSFFISEDEKPESFL